MLEGKPRGDVIAAEDDRDGKQQDNAQPAWNRFPCNAPAPSVESVQGYHSLAPAVGRIRTAMATPCPFPTRAVYAASASASPTSPRASVSIPAYGALRGSPSAMARCGCAARARTIMCWRSTRARKSKSCASISAAASRADVDALHRQAQTAGATSVESPAVLDEPGGGYGFALRDPEGRVLRVIAAAQRRADTRAGADQPGPASRTWSSTHTAGARRWPFSRAALGFTVSDRSVLTFVRCNADHHSIAFHPGEAPTLHHIAFEVPTSMPSCAA